MLFDEGYSEILRCCDLWLAGNRETETKETLNYYFAKILDKDVRAKLKTHKERVEKLKEVVMEKWVELNT